MLISDQELVARATLFQSLVADTSGVIGVRSQLGPIVHISFACK